jgi:peptidoglycan DL-endopeptidase CwlO
MAALAVTLGAAAPAFGDSAAIRAKQAEAQHVLAQINSLDGSLEKAIEAYDAATQKLNRIQSNLRTNQHELGVARGNLKRSQRVVEQRLVTLYTAGDQASSLGVLLGAGNMSDLLNRADTANLVAGQDVQVQRQVITFKKQVHRERIQLQHARAAQQQVVQQRADAKASISSQLAERHRLVASIRNQIVSMRQAEARRQAQLAAEARARAQAAAAAPAVVAAPAPSSSGSSGGGVINPPPSSVGGSVVSIAERYLGVPYVWGGASPSGFDCSGLVMYVYAQVGVSLPHNAAAQYGYGSPVSMSQLQPGDLVFFYGLGHVGIYIGGGQFIHAPHTGDVVKISSLGGYYASNFVGARRIL